MGTIYHRALRLIWNSVHFNTLFTVLNAGLAS